MKKNPFSKLGRSNKEGLVPMSELFDLAYSQCFKNELSPMISCFHLKHVNEWVFVANDFMDSKYELKIDSKWKIILLLNDDTVIQFNQYPLYKKLIELNFI